MADPPRLDRAIRDFQSGENVDANSRIIHRAYYRTLHRFFRRRGFDQISSEDLTQETFFRVYSKLKGYEHRGHFGAWLFTIAENVSRGERIQHSTLKRNAPELPYDEAVGPGVREKDRVSAESLPSTAPRQVERMYDKQRRAILDEAIQGLAPRQRECLSLRMLGHTYSEIAIIVRISRETVKQHLTAARKKLQQLLNGLDLTGLEEAASG